MEWPLRSCYCFTVFVAVHHMETSVPIPTGHQTLNALYRKAVWHGYDECYSMNITLLGLKTNVMCEYGKYSSKDMLFRVVCWVLNSFHWHLIHSENVTNVPLITGCGEIICWYLYLGALRLQKEGRVTNILQKPKDKECNVKMTGSSNSHKYFD